MTVNEALEIALKELESLSPEELREELDKYKDSDFVKTLNEMSEVVYDLGK